MALQENIEVELVEKDLITVELVEKESIDVNLTEIDILSAHNSLTGLNVGDYKHLTAIEYANLMHYVDRGDPDSYDFTKADFTADLQWHNLDLSAIVPEDTTLVHIRVRLSCFDLAGLQFRKKGNTNNINNAVMKIQIANIYYYEDFFVSCDSDRKIQYLSSNVTWNNLDLIIRGWFTK